MKLLILGGTIFLGRALAEDALKRGHTVTLFNRGQHNADWFPDVEKLRGNRDGDLDALKNKTWDAVIDTCGYVPRIVGASAKLLKDAVQHYTFISSISVYPDLKTKPDTEATSVATLADETTEQVTGETYGALKALCEKAAEAAMPSRVLNVRAGLIVGEHDVSGRFTYWPHRILRGGTVLTPPLNSLVQFIDVRDLAAWVLNSVEKRLTGTFNVTGNTMSLETVLQICQAVSNSHAVITPVSDDFLEKQNVEAYSEMPLWVPRNMAYFNQCDCTKALQSGLRFRPLAETVTQTLAWLNSLSDEQRLKALGRSLKPERETELLQIWNQRQN
jgi:2'-hydroxyisoflavone reductase